jgi:steroid 5-alpha reductase family enzyme
MNAALSHWAAALPGLLGLALVAWVVATVRRNVGLVDAFWALFFLAAAAAYATVAPVGGLRGWVAIALVAAWGLRLSGHLALRNWNAPEDRRYRAMRERNDPGFAWKSLYLVFGLQAVLAWVISAPLSPAIRAAEPLGILDVAGATLAAFGIAYEAIADRQLARFLAESGNSGGVMDRGLWRYSRHPNYFGECCTWWGLYLLAAGAGGAWTVFAPLLITFLLLRVSGVSLLEKDIGERRPAYRNYVRRTNAFLPGPPRTA